MNENDMVQELVVEDVMIVEGVFVEFDFEVWYVVLEVELVEIKQVVFYVQVEMQNVCCCMEKDVQDVCVYVVISFVCDILLVVDNLLCVFDVIFVELCVDDKFKGLVIGFEVIGCEFEKVFECYGIICIVLVGEKFDLNKYQVMIELLSDQELGMIVQEMQVGYMIKDCLLCVVMVGVVWVV